MKRMQPNAILPKRATPQSAGLDLYANADIWIQAKTRRLVPTGIRVIFPPNTFGKIEGRSHLAYFYQIDVMAGVVDGDYRGEIRVVLVNHNPDTGFMIRRGERIAQLLIHNIEYFEPVDIPDNVVIEPTTRGICGFGSTGI